MADPRPPALPDGAPKGLRDFVECREPSVEIADGPLTWIELPFTEGKADLSIKAGSTPGTATVSVDIPGLPVINLPATIKKGALSIDTSNLPLILQPFKGKIQPPIKQFVDDLNAWLKANGKALGPPAFGDGVLKLSKVDVTTPGQSKPPPGAVPIPPSQPVAPPPPAPVPAPAATPPPEDYYEPKYVTPPPLPKGEAFPYGAKAPPPTGSTSSVGTGFGPPVVGAGGPGGLKAPAGLGSLAVTGIVAAIVIAIIAAMGIFGFGPFSGGLAGQVATNPPSASTAARASTLASPSVAVSPASPTSTSAPSARPTTAPIATPGGKVIIGGLVLSDAPTLDTCRTGKNTRNRYSFSVLVALPGQANPPIEAYAPVLGRKATVVLAGGPDAGTYQSSVAVVNGRALIVVDGIPCPQTTVRSTYGGLTIEGLVLTPSAINADGTPAGFLADLPA